MKKKIRFICLIVLILFPFFVFFLAFWAWAYVEPIEHSGVSFYEDKEYESYKYGEFASIFLPDYESLSNYNTIEFTYYDSTNRNSIIKKYCLYYFLEVSYDESTYLEEKDILLSTYSIDSPINCINENYEYALVSNLGNDYTSYSSHFGTIAYNDSDFTIRYIYWGGIDTDGLYYCSYMYIDWD